LGQLAPYQLGEHSGHRFQCGELHLSGGNPDALTLTDAFGHGGFDLRRDAELAIAAFSAPSKHVHQLHALGHAFPLRELARALKGFGLDPRQQLGGHALQRPT
jgi:hypothetical protein